MSETTGILLINVGSPDSPDKTSVKVFLKEFLNDPRILDMPNWLRKVLVNFIIVPRRAGKSAEAYQKIWTSEGSPLITVTKSFAGKLENKLPGAIRVFYAMRYGRPAISEAFQQIKSANITRLILFPLYPQYAAATTGSALAAVYTELAKNWDVASLNIKVVPPFYQEPAFTCTMAKNLNCSLKDKPWDHLLFSYHGLPESHIKKSEAVAGQCLKPDHVCCRESDNRNRFCYRAGCEATTREIAKKAKISRENYSMSFQSRMGKAKWLKPYTTDTIQHLAKKGVKNLAVCCPAFVADCLETLEEIGMRAKHTFREAGGKDFFLVPGLNDSDIWVEAVKEIILKQSGN